MRQKGSQRDLKCERDSACHAGFEDEKGHCKETGTVSKS